MKRRKLIMSTILLALIYAFSINAQDVTFRFNPPDEFCFPLNELCLDVEIQADQPGVFLDEVNVRMFIDDARLVLLELRNPDPNYFLETGGTTSTGIPGSGAFFGFQGEFTYIIDNLKKTGSAGIEIAEAPGWTYLFEACFNNPNNTDFCLSGFEGGEVCEYVVWDHDEYGSGFGGGSDGIEALALNPNDGPGLSLNENVINYNWDYNAPDVDLDGCIGCCLLAIPETVDIGLQQIDCRNVKLNWSVREEIGNEGSYFIERRYEDEYNWENIAELKSIAQATFNEFEFIDNTINRKSGSVQYRLRFIDIFKEAEILGKTEIELQCQKESILNVFPNPSKDVLHIEFAAEIKEAIKINIYDTNGKLVFTRTSNLPNPRNYFADVLNLDHLTSGLYLLELINNQTAENVKFQKIQ